MDEAEFYVGKALPTRPEGEARRQRRVARGAALAGAEPAGRGRAHQYPLYDTELVRLKKLWAGRLAGNARSRCPGRQAPRAADGRSPPEPPTPGGKTTVGRAPRARLRPSFARSKRVRPRSDRPCPCVAFIAWPTRALNALSLPARNSSTDFGFAAITVVDDALELARVAHLAQASGVDQRVDVRRRSSCHSVSRSWRAAAFEMVRSATRAISAASCSAGTGYRRRCRRRSGAARSRP